MANSLQAAGGQDTFKEKGGQKCGVSISSVCVCLMGWLVGCTHGDQGDANTVVKPRNPASSVECSKNFSHSTAILVLVEEVKRGRGGGGEKSERKE